MGIVLEKVNFCGPPSFYVKNKKEDSLQVFLAGFAKPTHKMLHSYTKQCLNLIKNAFA